MCLFDLRMLFSNMMAKTSPEFAERRTTPEMSDGAVFIYGENFDVYVKMCLLFLDDTMTDETEPVVEVRNFPRILRAPFNHSSCRLSSFLEWEQSTIQSAGQKRAYLMPA